MLQVDPIVAAAQDTATKSEFQSRWGHHVCSYETYLLLKQLSRWYWLSRRQQATYDRWDRKAPWNRVHRVYSRNERGQKCRPILSTTPIPEPQVGPFIPQRVVSEFRAAKIPHPDPLPQSQLLDVSIIKRLHDNVSSYYLAREASRTKMSKTT